MFKVGDKVRVIPKGEREIVGEVHPAWGANEGEIYIIKSIRDYRSYPLYLLTDIDGNRISCSWVNEWLIPIHITYLGGE